MLSTLLSNFCTDLSLYPLPYILGKTRPEIKTTKIEKVAEVRLADSSFTPALLSVLPNPFPVGAMPKPGVMVEPGTVPGLVVPPMFGLFGVPPMAGGVPPVTGVPPTTGVGVTPTAGVPPVEGVVLLHKIQTRLKLLNTEVKIIVIIT